MVHEMVMKNFKNIVLMVLIAGVGMASADRVSAETLLKTSTSWDGGNFHYPTGEAEITSAKLVLEEGQILKFHCHPVPTFGHVLNGSLEVETKDGKKVLLNKGESVVEVMKTIHQGTALEDSTEILVFFAGAKSVPNTVFMDSEDAKKYCI